jgi:hypothetical protein
MCLGSFADLWGKEAIPGDSFIKAVSFGALQSPCATYHCMIIAIYAISKGIVTGHLHFYRKLLLALNGAIFFLINLNFLYHQFPGLVTSYLWDGKVQGSNFWSSNMYDATQGGIVMYVTQEW